LDEDDSAAPGDIQIIEDGSHRIDTKILIIKRYEDLAILQIVNRWDEVGLKSTCLASHNPKLGDKVFLSGYTANLKDVVTQGYIGKLLQSREKYAAGPVLDIRMWYGSSGGGIYNTKGKLVGVVSGILNGPTLCYGVTLDNILKALKETGL
jgi:S1-C subfamily serine protease